MSTPPQDAARLRLLIVPCSPSLLPVTAHVIPPNTAHGAGAAAPTPESPRGPASAPHGARCLHIPLRPGVIWLIKIIGCPKPPRHPVKTTSWGQGSGRFVDPHVCVPPETPRMPSVQCPPRASPLPCFVGPAERRRRNQTEQRGETPDNKSMAKPVVLKSPVLGSRDPIAALPPRGAHTFPWAPHSLGVEPTPAAARGDPQHPTEILSPASEADGDKDKTTPSLINKGPDSAASIRQAIPEPARPNPATKRLRAGIAAGIRQPGRGEGSGEHGAALASPFTCGCCGSQQRGRSHAEQRRLGEMGSPPGDAIKDTCKRENKRPTPPPPRPCSKQRQTWAQQHTPETQAPETPSPLRPQARLMAPPAPRDRRGPAPHTDLRDRDAQTETRGP